MIITNMLLAAIFFILFCIWMEISHIKDIKIEVKFPQKKNIPAGDDIRDAIKEADENERWG